MQKKNFYTYLLLNFLLAFFLSMGIHQIRAAGSYSRLNENTVTTEAFRSQELDEELFDSIQAVKDPGEILGLYWLEADFKPGKLSFSPDLFPVMKKKWASQTDYQDYIQVCRSIWNDAVYFPVPEPAGNVNAKVTFIDSWMFERNYGGRRGHEGTDIMAVEDKRGWYPVVSMTDGVILHKGWLEKGGYRLGITAPGGAYFYYAHLDSYTDLEEGDTVRAGDLLGYMGDTGYSKIEGTTGNFPVHLHMGIYIYRGNKEISINPYWILRRTESRKIKCVYSR